MGEQKLMLWETCLHHKPFVRLSKGPTWSVRCCSRFWLTTLGCKVAWYVASTDVHTTSFRLQHKVRTIGICFRGWGTTCWRWHLACPTHSPHAPPTLLLLFFFFFFFFCFPTHPSPNNSAYAGLCVVDVTHKPGNLVSVPSLAHLHTQHPFLLV